MSLSSCWFNCRWYERTSFSHFSSVVFFLLPAVLFYPSRLFWWESLSFGDISCHDVCLLSSIMKPERTLFVVAKNTFWKCCIECVCSSRESTDLVVNSFIEELFSSHCVSADTVWSIRYLNKTKLTTKGKKLRLYFYLPGIYANYLIQCEKDFFFHHSNLAATKGVK